MRKFIKFILLLIVLLLTLSYYGVFSLDFGFSESVSNLNWDIITIKEAKLLELGDSFYVSIATSSNLYSGFVDGESALGLAILSTLTRGTTIELSFWPLILAIIFSFVIILFPKKKSDATLADEKNVSDSTITTEETTITPQPMSKGVKVMIGVCVAIIIVCGCAVISFLNTTDGGNSNSNHNTPTLPDTTLDRNDINFELLPGEVTLVSIYYEITPNVDIEYIEYTIYIYDKDHSVINQQTEKQYNLRAGESYKYRVEVGFVNYFKADSARLTLIDGKKKV